MTYVDLSDVEVRPEFTPDGRPHRTGPIMGGAGALAGTDEGPGFWPFKQGRNRVIDLVTRQTYYRFSPRIRDAQSPKGIVLPGGFLNRITPFVQERVPVELFRIGRLYLIGIPGEVTITAGLRMRRAVAAAVGADVRDVLVAGYTNAYIHYVTTPEEYEQQRYEGGSTLFGKWEAPALTQIAADLAVAMQDGKPVDRGAPPPDLSAVGATPPREVKPDDRVGGRDFGQVLDAPRASYRAGQQVRVGFAGANPNHDLHRGATYLVVEREADGGWTRIADDGDWETKLHWKRDRRRESRVTISWDIPADIAPGDYRIRYFGDALGSGGTLTAFTGSTEPFTVTP
jgi:neutral ceramidase